MQHNQLILECAKANLSTRRIARQLYFLTPSFAFENRAEIQLQLYEKICDELHLPLSAIRLNGSGHTGFSLVKGSNFDKSKSDLDIALVDSNLYLKFFELACEEAKGWKDTSRFPGKEEKQKENMNSFLRYLRKGIIRPDLMPSSPEKAKWENFFGKLADEYSSFCNGISAGIYATEAFMAAKQESAIDIYRSTQGSK